MNLTEHEQIRQTRPRIVIQDHNEEVRISIGRHLGPCPGLLVFTVGTENDPCTAEELHNASEEIARMMQRMETPSSSPHILTVSERVRVQFIPFPSH